MKKILITLILGLSLVGCTSMDTGEVVEKNDVTYLKVTDNEVFFIKDNISLDKYYSVNSISIEDNFIKSDKQVALELRYYPKGETLKLLFPLCEDGVQDTIKGITFSNKEMVMNAEISNSLDAPSTELNKTQANTLYKLMRSDKPIILRILSSQGYFDMPFNEESKKGFAELLEIYLDLVSYDIDKIKE